MDSQKKDLSPKISVVLVDGSYRPHFAMVDSLKLQSLAQDDFEVLWIEYFAVVKKELLEKMDGQDKFRVITLAGEGTYHSSFCFNRGIAEARWDLLVIADADVLVDAGFLETIWREHQADERLVMYIYRMDEPERSAPMCLDLDYLKKKCVLNNPANYGGCLTVRKKWLLEINGYEQHEIFRTGGDHASGLDVYTRFKNLGMRIMWHPELRMYHPWHPHSPGFRDAYLLQQVLIRHRARDLSVLPFNGINPALDRGIPGMLQAQLDREMKKQAEGQPHSG